MTKCQRYQMGLAFLNGVVVRGNWWQKMIAHSMIKYIKNRYGSECDVMLAQHDDYIEYRKCLNGYCEDLK